MFTEARKTNLIEEVQKVTDEATLMELETIIEKSKKTRKKEKPSIYDFVGILTKKEASDMRKAIEETCETIQLDEWK